MVLCVGILLVQEGQTTANDFDNFLSIPIHFSITTDLTSSCKISTSGFLVDYSIWSLLNLSLESQSPQSESAQRTPNFEQTLHSNSCISETTGSIYCTKVAIEKSLIFEETWVKTPSTLVLHWNLGTEITGSANNLIIWTRLDFQTLSSPKLVPWVFSSRSQCLVSYFCCIIPIENVISHPLSGILNYQKWQAVLLILTCLEN